MSKSATIFLAASLLMACSEQDALPPVPLVPGGVVQVHTQDSGDFEDPAARAWRSAQPYNLDLVIAPPVHQSIALRHDASTPPQALQLRVARNTQRLFLLFEWFDESEDIDVSRVEFADAIAVQFALSDSADTSFMMGDAEHPVNIWYWRADLDDPQNLAAAGFGSTTPIGKAGLESSATYKDGRWQVIISRPLESEGEYHVDLAGTPHFSVARWQGSDRQRDGLKFVTLGWIGLTSTL